MARRRFRAKGIGKVLTDTLVGTTGAIANELAADLAEANIGFVQQNPQLLQPGMAAIGYAGQLFSMGAKPGQRALNKFFMGWAIDATKESIRSFTPLLSGMGQAAFEKKPEAQGQRPTGVPG